MHIIYFKMGIPKIIIQTWKSQDTIKIKYEKFIDKIHDLNPDFEYKFFDDDDVKNFININYPEFIDYFDSFQYNIQKYDFFRLLAVYHFGGFYIDIDVEIHLPLNNLCQLDCVFPKELKNELKTESDIPWVIGNYCFGASKNNDFIWECIKGIIQHQKLDDIEKDNYEKYILHSTGPVHISRTFFRNKFENIVCIETEPFLPYRFGDYGIHHMEGHWKNYKKKGGTELALGLIQESVEEIENYNIIISNDSYFSKTKKNIYFIHDLPGDPMLEGIGINNESTIIFVSHWQRNKFLLYFEQKHIFLRNTFVIENPIYPIPSLVKENKVCNIIYHTTPHRGLSLLCDVFIKILPLIQNMNILVHLDVYSSFKIYGRPDLDNQFMSIFQTINYHPNMTYHGYVSNNEIRKALQKAHIFAYPCIFQETSCLSLIEAMSAGCICVHSSLAALRETGGEFTMRYDFTENYQEHCSLFAQKLLEAIRNYKFIDTYPQQQYVESKYNISVVKEKWENVLKSLQ